MEAWKDVKKAWKFITTPWRKLWNVVKKVWNWLRGKTGFLGKVANGFSRMFGAIMKSKAWKAIMHSGIVKWVVKWGPTIIRRGGALLGKIGSVVGWIGLLWDVKDAAQMGTCISVALSEKNEANPNMPSWCDGAITKKVVSWISHKAADAI